MATQDFTTYLKYDPSIRLTITAPKIYSDISSQIAYVYKDKGANHFSGDFIHKFEMYLVCSSPMTRRVSHWMLANAIEKENTLWSSTQYMDIYDAVESMYGSWIIHYKDNGHNYSWNVGGTAYTNPKTYYVTVTRSGSTITVQLYSDVSRTVLVHTLTGDCQTSSYQYVYGFNHDDSTSGSGGGEYTKDLDLGSESTNWTQSLSDSVSESDALTKGNAKPLSDSISESESISKNSGINFLDNAFVDDAGVRNIQLFFPESISGNDAIEKTNDTHRTLMENVSENENIIKDSEKPLSDSVSEIDNVAGKHTGKGLTDAC